MKQVLIILSAVASCASELTRRCTAENSGPDNIGPGDIANQRSVNS